MLHSVWKLTMEQSEPYAIRMCKNITPKESYDL